MWLWLWSALLKYSRTEWSMLRRGAIMLVILGCQCSLIRLSINFRSSKITKPLIFASLRSSYDILRLSGFGIILLSKFKDVGGHVLKGIELTKEKVEFQKKSKLKSINNLKTKQKIKIKPWWAPTFKNGNNWLKLWKLLRSNSIILKIRRKINCTWHLNFLSIELHPWTWESEECSRSISIISDIKYMWEERLRKSSRS